MKLQDVLIVNDDIACDGDGMPIYITDNEVVIQDVRHRLKESGLLVQIVGLRNMQHQKIFLTRIKDCVEIDVNVIPGTVTIEVMRGNIEIRFKAYDFGKLVLTI